ncbi:MULTISPECIES: hypothetical protein [Pseudomonas]|nr:MULTISPECIES: hypothetical protein [Pseudomonas]KAF0867285.1 hypothetical protein PLD_02140 [Pseudomonas sp. LD120]MBP5105790.1 hypothetical protein [Pseudomonas protegens]MBP5131923.1 hypothetical protein [Pseudomonas protegens]MBP5150380.1 hypothetical protein [Pseudomonas protegens]
MKSERQELEKEFYEIQSKCDVFLNSLLKISKEEVARKIISKGALFNLRPFEIQRAGFKLGKELKNLPKTIKNTHVYYFDKSDRVVMIDIYGQSESIINRDFYFYDKESIKSIYINSTKTIRNITISSIVNGKVLRDANFGKYGSSTSDYLYDGERLSSILVMQKQHDQELCSTYQVLFYYLDGIVSKIINEFPNGYQEIRYP